MMAGMTACGNNEAASSAAITSGQLHQGATPDGSKTLAPGNYQVLVRASVVFAANLPADTETDQDHTIPLEIVVE
jgi:hypothetical protein